LKIRSFLLAMMLCALCVTQASALEYTFDAPEDYLFGQPTSDDTIYEWENPNVDRSKNAALIAPGFGSPTSYLPGSGEYLTPNLVPGALNGGLVNQVGSANINGGTTGSSVIPGQYPSVNGNVTMTQIPGGSPTNIAQGSTTGGYTEVTSDLYYSNGSLGTLKIPSIGLTVGVYEGTGSAPLLKGAGHFTPYPGGGRHHHPDHQAGDPHLCCGQRGEGQRQRFQRHRPHHRQPGDALHLRDEPAGVPLVRDSYPAGLKLSADCVRLSLPSVVWFGLRKPHHITKRRNPA